MAQENNSIESDHQQQIKTEPGMDSNDQKPDQSNNNGSNASQSDLQQDDSSAAKSEIDSRRENGGEPPVKKLRGNEEFDIRFLVSSKVNDACTIVIISD